jgi:excinuclease ABC subunit A
MSIQIEGASEHNLQDIDVEFGDGLTVVTGVSGSGKTSLVFDTLYHEARRRFLEIFSLGSTGLRLSPARVQSITGLGPAVAVGQNLLNRNPNSTLATASGLHPFLRLLYARFGERHCPNCGTGLAVLTEDEIVEWLAAKSKHLPLTIFAPILQGVQGSHRTLLNVLATEFDSDKLLVDGHLWNHQKLDPIQSHDIKIELGQLESSVSIGDIRKMVHTAWTLGVHTLVVRNLKDPGCLPGHRVSIQEQGDPTTPSDSLRSTTGVFGEWILSRVPVCVTCGKWFEELTPVHFHTSCPHCKGKGCKPCGGTGLYPEAVAVRWQGLRIPDLLTRSVEELRELFATTEFPSSAARLQTEITRRLDALYKVGLGYIALNRPSPTLSRGEAQRVRLAVILTSRLEDMLHVLDEPTIGQHPADIARLLPVFRELAGPVVYVEHDRVAAAAADFALDLGPGAGSSGGHLLFAGMPTGLWKADTPTGRYFSLRERVSTPKPRPQPETFLLVRGANLRNLQDINVPFPVGRLTVITGVSGSGKSTLVEDVFVESLTKQYPVGCQGIDGPQLKPVFVDQSPIGVNPRSNPATYTKLADIIRDCFASKTSLSASHFSFNRPEGACPECNGMGAVEVRMRYLPSTWIPCSACDGQRFSDEVLSARAVFGDRWFSIADVYETPVSDVMPLLLEHGELSQKNFRTAKRILKAMNDVGLGYLPLGQPSPTLSGGEAQRVKLVKYLGKRVLSNDLLVLDEPSTGLHPQDIAGLLKILDRLVRTGATVVIVEHNTDIIRAADWIIDLGPGAGPKGGRLLYAGPPDGLHEVEDSKTGQALRKEAAIQPHSTTVLNDANCACVLHPPGPPQGGNISPVGTTYSPLEGGKGGVKTDHSPHITIRNACAHNLKGVNVDFPKAVLTVVTGVSGSGKSSLVVDVLEAEAKRRFLETLSLYERQSTREGPEAPVESVAGLGVAITVGSDRRLYNRRATVGTATEIAHHLAVLFAWIGQRQCTECSGEMQRITAKIGGEEWFCPTCKTQMPVAQPRHFSSTTYAAACLKCHGVGTLQIPNPKKLIIHPEKPLCAGAMYSPGFFPKGYLGKPFNHGYDMVQALAARYNFDPMTTPWDQMSSEAQQAFLFGDPEPMQVTFQSRTRTFTSTATFPGFYKWIGDWDVGGTYTDTKDCPDCHGARLRPEYLAVTLKGYNFHQLNEMPLSHLFQVLQEVSLPEADLFPSWEGQGVGNEFTEWEEAPEPTPDPSQEGNARLHREQDVPRKSAMNTNLHLQVVSASLHTTIRRLRFLRQVGLGYLHLNRVTSTLSAGEAQRIKLAGLLGSGLTALTILLDEPSRGLHSSEVEALLTVLQELRDEGNTVIVIEHDPVLIQAADYLLDLGPGAGVAGGEIVARGTPEQVAQTNTLTARWLRGERRVDAGRSRREPSEWFTIRGACANNLRGEDIDFPLRTLVGICGVSGSGKSTLLIDTLGRTLAPKKHTTSVAYEPIEPGEHEAIKNAPTHTIIVDQARKGVVSPAAFLNLDKPLRALYAASDDAQALGINEKQLSRGCSVCKGRGSIKIDMGFLPAIQTPCETCRGTGHLPEAWEIHLYGVAFPELFALTIDEVYDRFGDQQTLARPLTAARDVGLGYLVLRQPGYTLSGGETQRLKIAKELCRKTSTETLYILDEPTVGQHLEDVKRLNDVLHRLVDAGHTVLVVEHHPHLLAACDWLIEFGPGGGPDGGRVIATGTPEDLAKGSTPIAPYLREVLGE